MAEHQNSYINFNVARCSYKFAKFKGTKHYNLEARVIADHSVSPSFENVCFRIIARHESKRVPAAGLRMRANDFHLAITNYRVASVQRSYIIYVEPCDYDVYDV